MREVVFVLIVHMIHRCGMHRMDMGYLQGREGMIHTTLRRVHDSRKDLVGSWSTVHRDMISFHLMVSTLSTYDEPEPRVLIHLPILNQLAL